MRFRVYKLSNSKNIDDSYFEFDINFNDFIENGVIWVDKIFETPFPFDFYYDSVIVNEIYKNYYGEPTNEEKVKISECLETLFHHIVVFYVLGDFISNSNVSIDENFMFDGNKFLSNLPSTIDNDDAFDYVASFYRFFYKNFNGAKASDDLSISELKLLFSREINDERPLKKELNDFLFQIYEKQEDAIEKLKQMTNILQTKGRFKTRCVALIKYKKKTYFSISGFAKDYKGTIFKKEKASVDAVYKKLYKIIKEDVFPHAKECHAKDECNSYYFSDQHLSFPFSLNGLIGYLNIFYSCCERKILSYLPVDYNIKDIYVFSKYEPCEKCIPALEGVDNIVYLDRLKFRMYLEETITDFRDLLVYCKIENGKIKHK